MRTRQHFFSRVRLTRERRKERSTQARAARKSASRDGPCRGTWGICAPLPGRSSLQTNQPRPREKRCAKGVHPAAPNLGRVRLRSVARPELARNTAASARPLTADREQKSSALRTIELLRLRFVPPPSLPFLPTFGRSSCLTRGDAQARLLARSFARRAAFSAHDAPQPLRRWGVRRRLVRRRRRAAAPR